MAKSSRKKGSHAHNNQVDEWEGVRLHRSSRSGRSSSYGKRPRGQGQDWFGDTEWWS